MKKRKYSVVEVILMAIVAIGLTLIVGTLFGAIVAYEVIDTFETSFATGVKIGIVSGLIGGIAVGHHAVEDFVN